MLAHGGFTPLEMLRAGTLDAARAVGLDGEVGSLDIGKLADVLVLEANPLEQIRATEQVRFTILNGRVFEARTMNQVYPEQVERGAFYFERPGGNSGLLPAVANCVSCAVPGIPGQVADTNHGERRYH